MDQADFLTSTRDGYDRAAANYAERFHHHLDNKPVDVAVLSAFAKLILRGSNTRVIDVGCGTGPVTALLDGWGVEVFGVDLSPNMLVQARRFNPSLSFGVGSMTSLPVADGRVGGICAWYSIIHVPDSHLADVFCEFHRVLMPGGLLLLAFQVGDEPLILTTAYGHDVNLTFARRQPQRVANQLSANGFILHSELVRQPDNDGFETTPHAYLIARKRV